MRNTLGKVSGIIGIIVNLILALVKIVLGFCTGSISILADGLNNFSDSISSVITFIGFLISSKPADKEHPFGHGRMEYLSGVFVSIFIILMGFEAIKDSIPKIFHPEEIIINNLVIVLIIMSIFVKLILGVFNFILSKEIDSKTIKAVSKDSFMDAILTSGILVSIFIQKYTLINLDGIIGFLIGIFVFINGLLSIKETISPLLGEPIKEEDRKIIEDILSKDSNILGYDNLTIHNYGYNNLYVSINIHVNCVLSLVEAHLISDNIEKAINKALNCKTIVHIDPV